MPISGRGPDILRARIGSARYAERDRMQPAQIEDSVNSSQQMIDWNPLIEPKFIEQVLLHPVCCPIIPRSPNRFDGRLQNTGSAWFTARVFQRYPRIMNAEGTLELRGLVSCKN
jgi:hypothetical protein